MIRENTNNFCTDQHLVVQYPNGAAGKFLITCFFLFDNVAHWEPDVQNQKITHWEWFQKIWPSNISDWSKVEPNNPWNINFFSRRLSRNNNISISDYNALVTDNASDYFFTSWNNGLKIVDHYHKIQVPVFYKQAELVTIMLNSEKSIEEYKHMVKKKLWLWDPNSKKVISTLDHPDYAHNPQSKKTRLEFGNKYEFTEYITYDDFFYDYLIKQTFVKDFISPDNLTLPYIDFIDLFDFEKLLNLIHFFEQKYNQSLDKDMLRKMHSLWKEVSQYQ